MPLVNLKLPPGIYRSETELQSTGRWYDANLVRWYQGAMQPVYGWRSRTAQTVTGRACGAFAWRDNTGNRYLAVGTHSKLYVYTAGIDRYDITPTGFTVGREEATAPRGFGVGNYGAITYGTPRLVTAGTGSLPATAWTFDNFGQYLVGCSSSDGKLYKWLLNNATAAVALTNAPTGNAAVMVTDERFVFALGAGGNPRYVRWSDQENWETWALGNPLDQAGDMELQTFGSIICGRRVRGGALILTTTDAHFARYLGPPYVYGFERVGTGCGIVSANAIAAVDVGAVWMSDSGFWMFDGYAKPLPCEVADYVFADLNVGQKSKVAAVHNTEFGEVWWFYPSSSSENANDKYVVWNYREDHWSIGALNRETGTGQGVFDYPLMIDRAGAVYEHDVGWNYDGLQPYAESGPLQLGSGDNVMHVKSLFPDEKNKGDVQVKFKTKFYPNGGEETFGPYSMSTPTDVRFTGRQVKMRIEPIQNQDWRVGNMRIDAVVGGKR